MVIFSILRSETPTTNKKHQPQRTKTKTGEKRKPHGKKNTNCRRKRKETNLNRTEKVHQPLKHQTQRTREQLPGEKEQPHATSTLKLKKNRLSQPKGNCET